MSSAGVHLHRDKYSADPIEDSVALPREPARVVPHHVKVNWIILQWFPFWEFFIEISC